LADRHINQGEGTIEEKRDFSLRKPPASPFEPQGKQEVKREEEIGLLRSKWRGAEGEKVKRKKAA